jgi:UvrB/UvrC motif-containing protein
MDYDISRLLDEWDYKPGQMSVRKFTAKDGTEKIQLRLDLGILQMNASGRPDGKRPFSYPSLLEYHQARLHKYVAEHAGSDDGFALDAEACAKLQMEALQYHHRYICLLELGDYHAVVRDTERNLAVFDFADKHAESDELSWALQQFRPQLLMVQARARATLALDAQDFNTALSEIDDAVEKLRQFYRDFSREDLIEDSPEIGSLESWREEVNAKRPMSKKEKLEIALQDAVQREDYEKAAQVRDALRNLKTDDA